MNYLPDQTTFTKSPSKADFAVMRSDWLDKFAQLEKLSRECLARFCPDAKPNSTNFSSRLIELSKAKPSSDLSRENAKVLSGLYEACRPQILARATMVHSILEIGTRGDQRVAFFQNVGEAVQEPTCYLVMAEHDFHVTQKRLQDTIKKLEAILKPPSPPQPKRDAAAGP